MIFLNKNKKILKMVVVGALNNDRDIFLLFYNSLNENIMPIFSKRNLWDILSRPIKSSGPPRLLSVEYT